jgi:hypothetical protein
MQIGEFRAVWELRKGFDLCQGNREPWLLFCLAKFFQGSPSGRQVIDPVVGVLDLEHLPGFGRLWENRCLLDMATRVGYRP